MAVSATPTPTGSSVGRVSVTYNILLLGYQGSDSESGLPTSRSSTPQNMIRRPPTLIPMTDADVQDIRALVARHKAAHDERQKVLSKSKTLAESPDPIVVPEAMTVLARQLADRARERDERERRLGIPPGQRSS